MRALGHRMAPVPDLPLHAVSPGPHQHARGVPRRDVQPPLVSGRRAAVEVLRLQGAEQVGRLHGLHARQVPALRARQRGPRNPRI